MLQCSDQIRLRRVTQVVDLDIIVLSDGDMGTVCGEAMVVNRKLGKIECDRHVLVRFQPQEYIALLFAWAAVLSHNLHATFIGEARSKKCGSEPTS
jgi:hypothetical protein